MLDQNDFITPITGTVVVANNSARIYLQTNAEQNINFEGNEKFKLIIRKGSTAEGPVVASSNTISIVDTSFIASYLEISTDLNEYIEGDVIHFTLVHPYKESNVTLYYKTEGNVTSNTFVGGNTGTIITEVNQSNLYLTTNSNAAANNTGLSFVLKVSETLNGPPVLVSEEIYVFDNSFASLGATGGTTVVEGTTKKHIFTSSSTFSVLRLPREAPVTISYMVQAGGGGGGGNPPATPASGGGGAGGHRTGTLEIPHTDPLPAPYTITVGGGGGSSAAGNPSSAFGTTSAGGGRGGSPPAGSTAGGSGGGGRWTVASSAGNTPPVSPPQGNSGSPLMTTNYMPRGGGGGGGAGGTGQAGVPAASPFPDTGRTGGVGRVSPLSPASYGTTGPAPGRYFGGGGGGGGGPPPSSGGAGGSGGGGRGGNAGANGTSGTGNTGGGGGGAGFSPSGTRTGGSGGSGIVIISYPIAV